MGFPDFSRPFIVETDASFQGLGAVLSQEQENGHVVIAYASRTLRPTERNMDNYSSLKLEMLALKWAVSEKFRDYLLGSKFVVFTDNNPLSYFKSAKLDAKEMRWAAQLAQFDFQIKYRSGKVNQNADALSRQSSHTGQLSDVAMGRVHVDSNVIQADVFEVITNSVPLNSVLKNIISSQSKLTVRLDSTEAAITAMPTFPSVEPQELRLKQESDHHIAQAEEGS